jgi:hypothetical protein
MNLASYLLIAVPAAGRVPPLQRRRRRAETIRVSVSLARAKLHRLARERRSLHAEGLIAVVVTVAILVACQSGAPLLVIAPIALLYAALCVGWVVRFVRFLGRDCPRCGGLFFYSLERLLTSLPYLSGRCAHCRTPLAERP